MIPSQSARLQTEAPKPVQVDFRLQLCKFADATMPGHASLEFRAAERSAPLPLCASPEPILALLRTAGETINHITQAR